MARRRQGGLYHLIFAIWPWAPASRCSALRRLRCLRFCRRPSPYCRWPILGTRCWFPPLADSGRGRHRRASHRLPICTGSGGAAVAMISWGAVAATALWLAGSIGLTVYVSRIGSYDKTYGSVGALIVLPLWFY